MPTRLCAIENEDQVLVSAAIVDELLGVLARKFARDPEELSRVALFLDDLCETVAPTTAVQDLTDEPANRILECALAGGADLGVTGDRAMLGLEEWRGIRIVTLAGLLGEVAERLAGARARTGGPAGG